MPGPAKGTTNTAGSDRDHNQAEAKNTFPKMMDMETAKRNTWWAVGHGIFFLNSLFYYIYPSRAIYKMALLGLSSSCLIEGLGWFDGMILSEATPFFLLSLVLYFAPPSAVVLLPLMLYSLLAIVGQCQRDPRVVACKHSWYRAHLAPLITMIANHGPFLQTIAPHLELLALPWLLISILSLGPVLPLAYISFLRWRTLGVGERGVAIRRAVTWWDDRFTTWTEHPACPKPVRKFYLALQHTLRRWNRITATTAASATNTTNHNNPGTSKFNIKKPNY